jgi:hypothetical protein
LTCLAPAASLTTHHTQALHEHGPVLGGEFVPIPLAGVGDEAAHPGVVFGTMGHEGQLVGGMELDQAAGGRLLLQHLRPAIVGKDPLDKVLAERHVVEPALLLKRQEREAVHDLPGEHARAVPLCHSMLIVHFHTK